MGSGQALSNGNEVQEVTELIRAFESINSMKIAIVLNVVEREGKPRLLVRAGPSFAGPPEQALKPWGLPQYVFEAGELVRLMGVVTRSLYGLDFELAQKEFQDVLEKEA